MEMNNSAGTEVYYAGSTPNNSGLISVGSSDGQTVWSSDTPTTGNTPTQNPDQLGDLDGDNDVDFVDFILFSTNFGKSW